MGLIQDIMQIKRDKQLNRQHDEAFATDQALKNMNMSATDIMNQMSLGQAGQRVTDGKVDEPTTSQDVASQMAGPSVQYKTDDNGQLSQNVVPASGPTPVPAAYKAVVPGGPTPVSPDRNVVTYKSPTAGPMQFALNSDSRNNQLADDKAARLRQSKALDINSDEHAKVQAQNDAQYEARQAEIGRNGVELPSYIADTWGLPRGMKVLPSEAEHWMEKTEALRNGNQVVLKPGEQLIERPGGDTSNPNNPNYQVHVLASGGEQLPTDDFGKYFLPAFRARLGKKPGEQLKPDEMDAALSRYKEVNADPEMRSASLATKQLMDMQRSMMLGQMPTQADAARMAQQIANHELAPSQLSEIRGRGNGSLGTMIEREMSKVDPHFNWSQADSDYAMVKSPGFQNNIRYMDGALSSIPRLQASADALKNGKIRSVNNLLNMGRNQFNSVDLKRFQTDKALVGDEIAKILQGGGTGSGTSDTKLKQAQDLVKDSDDPAAISTALQEVNALIGNRRQALTRGTYLEGRTMAAESPATPAAAAAPASSGGGGFTVTDPRGVVHKFTDQAHADAFKKAAGIQ